MFRLHTTLPLLFGLGFLLVSAPLVANTETGTLTGIVSDEGGQALPGVAVNAIRLPTELSGQGRFRAYSGADGRYQLRLPVGSYEVRFELDGFSTVVSTAMIARAKTRVLDVSLPLAGIQEELLVVSGSPTRRVRRQRSREVPAGWYRSDFDTESYNPVDENRFRDPHDHPLSTFATDVDTASFSNVRRFLENGEQPPRDAVRLEELLNYFNEAYGYPEPEGEHPFSVTVDVASAPWQSDHQLVRIGLRGTTYEPGDRPAANLVFLIDVSGSMADANKLPWVSAALKMLVEYLQPYDRVSIVVYAGASGVVLEPTWASDRHRILSALEDLQAGGSTNGGEGIELAYRLAREGFDPQAINRVILVTDGDWNVGLTDRGSLVRRVRQEAQSQISLSVLGFGMGNYKDDLLEDLSRAGDGNYAYIDSLQEARKVLIEQMEGTLLTIAKEVKIQVEFNPARVASYRLLGYENRLLPDEDFADDSKDGGEIGAGHTVTALYEIVPSRLAGPARERPRRGLRYQRPAQLRQAAASDELLSVSLRYQLPSGGSSHLIEVIVDDPGAEAAEMAAGFQLAAGLAAMAMLLRDSPHRGSADWNMVESLVEGAAGSGFGRAAELMALVQRARELVPIATVAAQS